MTAEIARAAKDTEDLDLGDGYIAQLRKDVDGVSLLSITTPSGVALEVANSGRLSPQRVRELAARTRAAVTSRTQEGKGTP